MTAYGWRAPFVTPATVIVIAAVDDETGEYVEVGVDARPAMDIIDALMRNEDVRINPEDWQVLSRRQPTLGDPGQND